MTEQPDTKARDSWVDLNDVVGTPTDVKLRMECLRAAIGVTPKFFEPNDQQPAILFMARRFAQFVLDGTTPGLQVRAD